MKFSSRVPVNIRTTVPLIDYLLKRFSYHDRTTWLEKIESGKVFIDGIAATESSTVSGGQRVTYDAGEFEEPPADLHYSILYEDAWILAVNKPGDLLVHRAGKSFRNNLMYQLRCVHTPPYPDSHSIHRLDRFTSGIVLIAKNSEVQAAFSRLFMARQMVKHYTAIVHGIPSDNLHEINLPIAKNPDIKGPPRFRVDAAGKEATTLVLEIVPIGTRWARLSLQPRTGRTHQLRVHCAHIGHPILGDTTYGSLSPAATATLITDYQKDGGTVRQALHCASMSFRHPFLNSECTISAPLPQDMKTLIEHLRNH
jgi:23S rRNA pseudouridine1911/1915/1917 synthase